MARKILSAAMSSPDDLCSLVYFSRAAVPMDGAGLQQLLETSRRNNLRLNITGLLIYSADTFAQYLEGPREAVESLFATIRRDPRHRDVRLLTQGPIEERAFPDWSMTFREIGADVLARLPGEVDRVSALREVLDLPATSVMAVTLKSLSGALLTAAGQSRSSG